MEHKSFTGNISKELCHIIRKNVFNFLISALQGSDLILLGGFMKNCPVLIVRYFGKINILKRIKEKAISIATLLSELSFVGFINFSKFQLFDS